MKPIQQHLLTLQILAVVAAFTGELAGVGLLVSAGVAIFFVALAALFTHMTTALVTGVRQSDGRAMAR